MTQEYAGKFHDSLSFDTDTKTAVSFRDGVLTYLGSEIGMEPADKEFTVYRSPATIANAARLMQSLPLTDDHVSLDEAPSNPVGTVEDSEMVDMFNDEYHSTVGVRNRVKVTDLIRGALDTGKRQLSLGYGADLVPHSKYDFEQKGILPHHLAVVQAGRCGPACAFIDRKPNIGDDDMGTKDKGQEAQKPAQAEGELISVFSDAEGQPNLEQIVEIAQGLPEALRKLPMDKLQEVMPQLQEIVAMSSSEAGETAEPDMADEEPEEQEAMDESEEGGKKMAVTDSAEFKDAVANAIKAEREKLGAVIDKAKDFVDADYCYHGKAAEQIMRDALATQHNDVKFEDAELPVAFKLLKPSASNLKNFGDGKPDAQTGRFSQLSDKEA